MVRHADPEMTVIKKFYTHRSSETGYGACHTGSEREAPMSLKRWRESGENVSKSLHHDFPKKQWGRQVNQA